MCYEPKRGKAARPAFTLIELLVVVAIIAILLSILLPSLERARAQARQLLGLTNERAQGQAAQLYSGENSEYIPRGLQDFTDCQNPCEYAMYATALMPALGYPNDPFDLWVAFNSRTPDNPCGNTRGNRGQGGINDSQKFTRKIFKGTYGVNFQCPDYPTEAHAPIGGQPGDSYPHARQQFLEDQYLDYVANAMPTSPYTNSVSDLQQTGNDDRFDPVPCGQEDYIGTSKLSAIEAGGRSAAETIYITEAHASLQWDNYRFHHFFLVSHLPFAGKPRIANDQRHPGGLNCLFFDGHAKTLSLKSIDPGWPNSVGVRLRWFATVPPELY